MLHNGSDNWFQRAARRVNLQFQTMALLFQHLDAFCHKHFLVSYPRLKHGGLCLNSTATQHTWQGVLLWLPRSTHQGVLTKHPFLSSLAG